jgi:predicted GTPase
VWLGYGKKSEIIEKKSKEIRVAIVGKPNVGMIGW